MSSNGWAEIVLVVMVLAPIATVFLATAVALPEEQRQWTVAACGVSVLAAAVLLIGGQHPEVARLAPDELALAAAIPTGLLALGMRASANRVLVAVATSASLCGLAAGAVGDPSTVAPVLGIVAVCVVSVATRDTTWPAGVASLAALAAAWGVRAGGRGGAAAVVVAVAVIAIAASFVPRRSLTLVVPSALVLGLRAAPTLSGTATARWVAVVLAAGGAMLAVMPRVTTRWRVPRPPVGAVVVPWTLVAAVEPVPGTSGAARALAAAAVLALLLGGPLALLAALPGTAMLVGHLVDGGGWPRAALGALLTLTLAGVVATKTTPARGRVRLVDGVAVALAGWLVIRPTAWTWANVSRLDAYNDGTVAGLAAALIVFVASMARTGRLDIAPLTPWIVVDVDDDHRPAVRWPRLIPAVAVTAAMGIAAALLLRSARL